MQPTEHPNSPASSVLRIAWRITVLYLQKSLRLYVGPAQWKGFPDSIVFAAISMALAILLYTVQLLRSGHPLSVYWVNLLIAFGAGAIILMVRHDMPFNSAGIGVMLVGLLLSMALEGLQSSMAGHPQRWGAMPAVLHWIDDAWQTWMLVTILRLSVAKLIEVERPKRDTAE